MNSKTLIHFEFTDVDENTVIDVLRQLPLKSSFGFDGISSHLLHNIELYLVKTTYTTCQTNPHDLFMKGNTVFALDTQLNWQQWN